jgi:hypothetical protein
VRSFKEWASDLAKKNISCFCWYFWAYRKSEKKVSLRYCAVGFYADRGNIGILYFLLGSFA